MTNSGPDEILAHIISLSKLSINDTKVTESLQPYCTRSRHAALVKIRGKNVMIKQPKLCVHNV